MYMRTMILAASLTAVSLPASAQSFSSYCSFSGAASYCWTGEGGGSRQIVNVPETQEDVEARRNRIARWTKFCEPVLSAPDNNGMRRYSYRHPGCEHGRSE